MAKTRSVSMTIVRPEGSYTVEYDAGVDEVVIRKYGAFTLALRFDQFIEAIERRVDDDKYRPISEADRAREAHERSPRR